MLLSPSLKTTLLLSSAIEINSSEMHLAFPFPSTSLMSFVIRPSNIVRFSKGFQKKSLFSSQTSEVHFKRTHLWPERHFRIMSSLGNNECNSGDQTKVTDSQRSLTELLANQLVHTEKSSLHPMKLCIAIAGGGSNSASAIASIPGASSILLETIVTYDRHSFADFVSQNLNKDREHGGFIHWMEGMESMEEESMHSSTDDTSSSSSGPFRFCSRQAAILLSRSALHRSLQLSPSLQDRCLHCVGVGCTSSLVGSVASNGDDSERKNVRKSRAFIACSTLKEGTVVWEVQLSSDNNLHEVIGVRNEPNRMESTRQHQYLDMKQSRPHEIPIQMRRSRAQEEALISNLILLRLLKHFDTLSEIQISDCSQPIMSQILDREGDTITETWYKKTNESSTTCQSSTPSQSPATGALQIIENSSNIVLVLPTYTNEHILPKNNLQQQRYQMKTLLSDKDIPFSQDFLIVPGSFNPPHIGHMRLANAAVSALRRMRLQEGMENNFDRHNGLSTSSSFSSLTSSQSTSSSVLINMWHAVNNHLEEHHDPTVLFEMSVTNVDKPPINPEEVERRLNLFLQLPLSEMPKDWGVILTNAPLFSRKASILNDFIVGNISGGRKMTFVIGTDTMMRIINPKYYGDSLINMTQALMEMKDKGVHFIVGGRLEQGIQNGAKFVSGRDEIKSIPYNLQQMFTLLEEENFRVDISSTELRKKILKD